MIFKCKICGGDLGIEENRKIATCEYCGTKQTLPKLENEKIVNLYDRANYFRRNNEYDKAEAIYEMILNEDAKDAEVYWSILLCEYGVEYVEDPKTHEYIPTCNRTQKTSILASENYKQALKYAEDEQKELYQVEAEKINNIQKKILEISNKEEPFDIFICYKEKDENGQRTEDSVIAQELYYQLQKEGFKVFFAKVTLEDKIGESYEPYIYSALNSAKIMLVVGTKKEYFDAVWVKNEWSRYLALMKNGESKTIIPCYKDIDAYDLPEEFAHLQAQDMGKLGFEQDLIYGIKKIINVSSSKKNNKAKPIIIGIISILLVVAIIIGIIVSNKGEINTKTSNEVSSTQKREILKKDIGSSSGYTFNMTLGELKDKISEWIDSTDNEYGIDVKIVKDELNGENFELYIGWLDGMLGMPEFIGVLLGGTDENFNGENAYISDVICIPTKYGGGPTSLTNVPVNIYEQVKKILGSETEEWTELVNNGTITETTYDYNNKVTNKENLSPGMKKILTIK